MPTDPLAELQAEHQTHRERHEWIGGDICVPEYCPVAKWLALCDRLAAAGPTAVECGAWHCSGQRRCELERGHAGRHVTPSLGTSLCGWDDSASVDVPQLLDALNDARAPRDAAEQERDRLAAGVPPAIHAPTDHEVLAAAFSRAVDLLHAAERERDLLAAAGGAVETQARLDIAEGKLEKIAMVMAGRGGDVWP